MTNVSLTKNFFGTARGLTFKDSASVTWSFNQNTNELTATSSGGGGGSGTVTSVALADGSSTALYTITGSPVIAAGTLTFSLKTQTANTVLAGPTTGAAAQPTFRGLVIADLPTGIPNANLANSSVTVTAGTGLSTGGSVSLGGTVTLNLTVPVVAVNGGTGQTVYAVGDLLYASTTTALSKLADVATGQVLRSGGVGVAPAWGALAVADLPTGIPNANLANSSLTVTAGTGLSGGGSVSLGGSVTLSLTSPVTAILGGTGQTVYAVGDLLYASTTTALSKLADVAVGQYLKSGGVGVAPAWGTIAYADITGTPSIPVGANPTASLGLAAINGVAATFMRSDGAPALDVTIAPTWTGSHVFSNNSNSFGSNAGTPAVIINGAAGNTRDIQFRSAGVNRWILRISTGAESGGNAGSDLTVLSRDDSGAAINTVVTIKRSSGLVTLTNGLTVTGLTTATGGLVQPFDPGSLTVPTAYFMLMVKNLTLAGSESLVLAGTSHLRILP